MTIFFTSDHHFGHANIIKYCNRPFSHTSEMDKEMFHRWNQTVQPDDTVYYLGDFAMQFKNAAWWVPQLNGQKFLICGNHDNCHPYRKGHQQYIQQYLDLGFLEVATEVKLKLPLLGQETVVKLHHLPYSSPPDGSGRVDKYAEYRPTNEGELLLCGHVHDAWLKQRNMINVGVDCHNFRPIDLKRIEEVLKQPDTPARVFDDGGRYRDGL